MLLPFFLGGEGGLGFVGASGFRVCRVQGFLPVLVCGDYLDGLGEVHRCVRSLSMPKP